MSAPPWRPVVLLAAVLGLSGCATWQATTAPAPQVIVEERPSAVRLTLADGGRVILDGPELRADSIVGAETITRTSRTVSGRRSTTVAETQRRGVPVADVLRIDVRHTDGVATFFAVVPLALVGLFVAALASCDIC